MNLCSRADIVKLLDELGEDLLDAIAGMTGYYQEKIIPDNDAHGSIRTETADSPSELHDSTTDIQFREQRIPLSFLIAKKYTPRQESAKQEKPVSMHTDFTEDELKNRTLGKNGERVPESPPLSPWPRLERRVAKLLREEFSSRTIDIEKLVTSLSRGKIPQTIPHIKFHRWPKKLSVVVDRSRRLTPFWNDQEIVLERCRQRIGDNNVDEYWTYDGNPYPIPMGITRKRNKMLCSCHGATVLVLGDCGALADDRYLKDQWCELSSLLQKCVVKCFALNPAPFYRIDSSIMHHWKTVLWEELRCNDKDDKSVNRSEKVRRLLGLISPAVRVEPGLLRSIRRLLPVDMADSGTEADVWSDPALSSGSSVALTIDPASQKRLRAEFDREKEWVRIEVMKTIRKWRLHLPKEIWAEEILGRKHEEQNCFCEDIPEAREYMRKMTFLVRSTIDGTGTIPAGGILDYWNGYQTRTMYMSNLWNPDDEKLGRQLHRTWKAFNGDKNQMVSPGNVDLSDDSMFGSAGERRFWQVWQTGTDIEIGEASNSEEFHGSPVCILSATRPNINIVDPNRSTTGFFGTVSNEKKTVFPYTRNFRIETDKEKVDFGKIIKPEWAEEIGRDEYGLYVDIEVKNVRQRMRWINPGHFLMGSPEGEKGRYGNEKQHEVILTNGYWLFDTPVTQALWEAVMGNNPSEYKSPKRPVEMVSWKDCKEFITKINEMIPHLLLRLPTEAEWEHACRAGSTAATYAGDMKILGGRNAPVLDTIAWYGGNSGVDFELENGYYTFDWKEKQYNHIKAGTHPVTQKQPNRWGLFDMIGNVWEWCEDWYEKEYPDTQQTDPQGPEYGDYRVLRSGSWFNSARSCRSASRYYREQGSRNDTIGFRLSRGQEQVEQEVVCDGQAEGTEGGQAQRPEALEIQIPEILKYRWHKEYGQDEYGIWLDFAYKDAVQRMRCIKPGRFTMGAPENEPKRENEEIPHNVMLTQGYWLADTACTQELWEVVMGSNPSNFIGAQRPVETVSWDDCREFLQRINSIPELSGIGLRLPTEAQWEYACRAGTITPFSFGENITTVQVNYDGNYPYVDGENGLYRQETVKVKSLPPNAWGLYGMHGNVWEWCNDWYGDYTKKPITDPQGPENGVLRVLRGGSWFDDARHCRSACRDYYEPSDRFDYIGFRLSRGQRAQVAEQVEALVTGSRRGPKAVWHDATSPEKKKKGVSGIFKKRKK
ncbi:MAG TPA: formylglycine-generating enzyme family protein [Chitinispirillaceae bacterium]|nr:formylglycine-generating enzyme family protein [Chitinispirillaceae bacterium]